MAAHEKYDILITGDLSQNEEYRLLSQNELRGIELLVAGHHGAATSTSDALLAQTGARTVILSVGADNSYGHPAAQTLARIQNVQARQFTGRMKWEPSSSGEETDGKKTDRADGRYPAAIQAGPQE
ncbi:MAG: hypothetical protein V8T01_02985 [Oscillospiraceae bacterium]